MLLYLFTQVYVMNVNKLCCDEKQAAIASVQEEVSTLRGPYEGS